MQRMFETQVRYIQSLAERNEKVPILVGAISIGCAHQKCGQGFKLS